MARGARKSGKARAARTVPSGPPQTESYRHPEATSPGRPDAGLQSEFRARKPAATWRYDSSLSPALDWDSQNGARELGEWLLACIEEASRRPPDFRLAEPRILRGNDGAEIARVEGLADAVDRLKRLSRPFLDWAGKAERLSFDVPTLPLFVHERLSTEAIIETLRHHRVDAGTPFQSGQLDLFGDPRRPVRDQILRAYEYPDEWVNRLILGDSLVVMNSLLKYEGQAGKVQMVYVDPPYGVRFGSNFQPFVRKRDVKHNDDVDLTREPEMVKAYRDTWELGLHSYLAYLRDRFLLARDLLHASGSIFVQISDENIHHVRELLDEIFGAENFMVVICYRRLGMMVGETLQSSAHYLLWYARDKNHMKQRKLFVSQSAGVGTGDHYTRAEHRATRETRLLTPEEKANPALIPTEWRPYQLISLTTGGFRPNTTIDYAFEGKTYHPGPNKCWRTTREGLDRLAGLGRIAKAGATLRYKQYLDDFPFTEITSIWDDTARDPENFYVVQTPTNIVRRCLHMTTDPGDLVLDLTCGSGTTAYVAERWGRRWIAVDTSRVPLALTRQRLLSATYPYYELRDRSRGPAAGFVYQRRQNQGGVETGGIVPHITLKSIATNESPEEEILVDRPEIDPSIVRVCGRFAVEATIPTALNPEPANDTAPPGEAAPANAGDYVERMLAVLRRAPVLHLPQNQKVELKNVRPHAPALVLHAEAMVEPTAPGQKASLGDAVAAADERNKGALGFSGRPVAIVFGPENGALSEHLVSEAAREARNKGFTHLYVIGFAIEPEARSTIELADRAFGIGATYVTATPDLMMGDLLKTLRSSQIFSVCGLPEIETVKLKETAADGAPLYRTTLVGLDVYDPANDATDHRPGSDVPCWMLDSDYNGRVFRATQVFFPRTSAWENLRKALKATHEDSVWEHLAGNVSAPYAAGEHKRIAVKAIDDRGNELMVVQAVIDARPES